MQLDVGAPRFAATVRLTVRAPFHAAALLEFLGQRVVAGIDEVGGGRYRRGLRLVHGPATIEVTPAPSSVRARLAVSDERDLGAARARCRRLCDLAADPVAVDAVLARDPALAPAVAADPGVRVPGAVDGFEMAVRAIVGQQISVAGARTILHRLVVGTGTLAGQGFPTPEAVAGAPDEAFGMPVARRRTLRALAVEVAAGRLDLDPPAPTGPGSGGAAGAARVETYGRLLAIPGIGPWTAQYVGMRALGDRDVLLSTDLGVRRGAAALGLPDDPAALAAHGERHWAPWRSYATIRLWRAH